MQADSRKRKNTYLHAADKHQKTEDDDSILKELIVKFGKDHGTMASKFNILCSSNVSTAEITHTRAASPQSLGHRNTNTAIIVSKALEHALQENIPITPASTLAWGLSCREAYIKMKLLINTYISFKITSGRTFSVYSPLRIILEELTVAPYYFPDETRFFYTTQSSVAPYYFPAATRFVHTTQSYNQPLVSLPFTVTHLVTGYSFNHPVDDLPPRLTHFTTGQAFNSLVDKLPTSLTFLDLGEQFNQSVDPTPATPLTW